MICASDAPGGDTSRDCDKGDNNNSNTLILIVRKLHVHMINAHNNVRYKKITILN